MPLAGRAQEAGVERRVVRDEHGAAQELQDRGQHGRQPRRPGDHRGGDAGERDDVRRQPGARVDQRGQLAEQLAAAHLDRADLGDRVGVRRAAGGLQVEHDEGDLAQRRAQLVERELRGGRGAGTVADASGGLRQNSGRRRRPRCRSAVFSVGSARTRITWSDVRRPTVPADPPHGGGSGPPGSPSPGRTGRRPGRTGRRRRRRRLEPAARSRCAAGWPRRRRPRSGAMPAADVPAAAAPAGPVHPGQAGPARRRRAGRRAGRVGGVPGRRRRVVAGQPPGRADRRPPTTRWRRPPRRCWPATRRAADAVAAAARRAEAGELRAERDAARARVDKLTVELERLRGELAEARAQAREAGAAAGRGVPAAAPPGVRAGGPAAGGGRRRRRPPSGPSSELRRATEAELAAARARARPGTRPGRGGAAAGRTGPRPRWRRPGRRPGRPGRPTRSGWRCCWTPSAARCPGCAGSWTSAAAPDRGPADLVARRADRAGRIGRPTGGPRWTRCSRCRRRT